MNLQTNCADKQEVESRQEHDRFTLNAIEKDDLNMYEL